MYEVCKVHEVQKLYKVRKDQYWCFKLLFTETVHSVNIVTETQPALKLEYGQRAWKNTIVLWKEGKGL